MSDQIEKSFYSIGEVSRMLKLPPSLIRFWEKEFDLLKPEKSTGGTRKYSQQDIRNLKLIHHLVKEKGFTLHGANEKLKHAVQVDADARMIDSLKHVREFLVELKKTLDRI
jgi:DNA-binding transcriptional MerR regulator